MSRGLGHVQRSVLDALAEQCNSLGDGWLTVPELAGRIAGPCPSRAESESVRRAVKRLARDGFAEAEYFEAEVDVNKAKVDRGGFYVHRRPYHGYRRVLAAHWPLSVEERDARARFYRESLDRLAALDARLDGAAG